MCAKNNGIATIGIKGEIVTYFVYAPVSDNSDNYGSDDAVSSEEVVACISDIKYDNNIMGVIVEIDSIGGSPVGSEEIANAIKRLGKPTVAVVRERAISGAYLIATATNKIFASEISDIGSIGVTMSYLDYSLKKQNEGIIYQQISSAKFKDTGDPNKPLSAEEKELFMRDVKIIHESFVKKVSSNRNLNIETVRKLADGSSMLGVAAKENGLIDDIRDSEKAKEWLKNKR